MNVAGYETGPIGCAAAFVADFDVAANIPLSGLVSKIDSDRQSMDVRRGMRSNYVPLRFDPATGAHQIGGRYLFETWDDVVDYMRFTSEELEFEPGTKFWDRSFFSNIDKRAWHVVGAHDFTPLATHYVSRFERFAYDVKNAARPLEAAWPAVRDAAAASNRASVWLLNQPDDQQIGLLTVATQLSGAMKRTVPRGRWLRSNMQGRSPALSPATSPFARCSIGQASIYRFGCPGRVALTGIPRFFRRFPCILCRNRPNPRMRDRRNVLINTWPCSKRERQQQMKRKVAVGRLGVDDIVDHGEDDVFADALTDR